MKIDREKLKKSVRLFLEAIGEDPDREGLKDTPDRIVRLWEEFKSHENFNMTIFEDVGEYDEMFSYRPQVQERLTAEIAEFLESELNPKGVAVVLEAEHLCMSMRGVKNPTSYTVTSKLTGVFKDNEKTRNEFLNLIHNGRG